LRSLKPGYLKNMVFSSKDLSTLIKLGEYKGKQELFSRQSPESLGILKRIAIIESTESSNRLEGIITDHSRVRALALMDTTPKNRTEQEIAGYKDALNLIHEDWNSIDFSTSNIKRIHNLMYRYLPYEGGLWKKKQNYIIEELTDGSRRLRFKPTLPRYTPKAMEDLVDGYDDTVRGQKEPLVIIPLVVFDFLCIHPFLDGNGRVARLLTLLLLYQEGYNVGKFISLERIFEDSKESYYETLEASSQDWSQGKHDIMPWLRYFWGVMLKAYEEFEERVGTITTVWGSKKEMIIITIKHKIGHFSISEIHDSCPGISREMVRHVVKELKDQKMIVALGRGRSAKWKKINEKRWESV